MNKIKNVVCKYLILISILNVGILIILIYRYIGKDTRI